jgi:hypothetical protein
MSIFERQPTIRWGFQSPKYKFRFAQQRDDKGDFKAGVDK